MSSKITNPPDQADPTPSGAIDQQNQPVEGVEGTAGELADGTGRVEVAAYAVQFFIGYVRFNMFSQGMLDQIIAKGRWGFWNHRHIRTGAVAKLLTILRNEIYNWDPESAIPIAVKPDWILNKADTLIQDMAMVGSFGLPALELDWSRIGREAIYFMGGHVSAEILNES
jgi:hypothetical protein